MRKLTLNLIIVVASL